MIALKNQKKPFFSIAIFLELCILECVSVLALKLPHQNPARKSEKRQGSIR